jgi:D-3-phosphoglycerate dehydrogenase
MRVLFADSLPETVIATLQERGHQCEVDASLGAADLADRVAGVDVLVVRSTKVPADVFEAADRLGLVVRAGAGTNTIDTAAAASRGVLVANVPGRNAAAVAELTMGLLIAVDRRIADNAADLRAGRWDKKRYSQATGLLGSTMGIIGLGSIGLCVAERARAFGIEVQVTKSPRRSDDVAARAAELGVTTCASLPELLSTSDIVSVHVPASPETRHLVDREFLGHLRPGAILLNTSRGDVVDEAAPSMPTSPAAARPSGTPPSRDTRLWWAPTTSAPRPSRLSWRLLPASWRSSTPTWRARHATASTWRRTGSAR